jgi:hypothetical protein
MIVQSKRQNIKINKTSYRFLEIKRLKLINFLKMKDIITKKVFCIILAHMFKVYLLFIGRFKIEFICTT